MATKSPRGRTGNGLIARQLGVLLSALNDEGDTITVEGIMGRLGVDKERASKLMSLLEIASTSGDMFLPISPSNDETGVSLQYSDCVRDADRVRGYRIRLTRSEAIALGAALDCVGIEPDDPLRKTITESFAPHDISLEEVARIIGSSSNAGCSANLDACSSALLDHRTLSFSYQSPSDDAPCMRTVDPVGIRSNDATWYLDAFDLDRQGDRTFRLERMGDVTIGDSAPPRSTSKQNTADAREVALTFHDPSMLDIFSWWHLSITHQDADGIEAALPWLGGQWLVRHLAACAGTVEIHDAELAQAVRDYARSQLA